MAGFDHFALEGRTALVTGGSSGLGFGIAEALLRAGARTIISGRGRTALDAAAEALAPHGEVMVETVDLYDRADVDDFARRCVARAGSIDIFVGNAGAVHAELIDDMTLTEIDRVMQLNLVANMQLAQAFVPGMRERRWGRLIFSSSTASGLAAPLQGNIAYAASKSGLDAFSRALAADLGRDGITSNVIQFGVFWTSILEGAIASLRETQGEPAVEALLGGFTEMTALGRLGQPSDVHGLVQLLASDAGGYITGASIPLEGGTGIMMRRWP